LNWTNYPDLKEKAARKRQSPIWLMFHSTTPFGGDRAVRQIKRIKGELFYEAELGTSQNELRRPGKLRDQNNATSEQTRCIRESRRSEMPSAFEME
jgi:hypothetical protein